jgi:hypothetical protein
MKKQLDYKQELMQQALEKKQREQMQNKMMSLNESKLNHIFMERAMKHPELATVKDSD